MTIDINPDLYAQVPDEHGRFGIYGGKFVAETLMSALAELENLYNDLKDDPVFLREFDLDLRTTLADLRLCTKRRAGQT